MSDDENQIDYEEESLVSKKDEKNYQELSKRKGGIHPDYKEEEQEEKFFRTDNYLKTTNTNVHVAYAILRIKKSNYLRWPPRILEIKDYIDKKYERKTLCTELTLPLIELALNLPIQLDLLRGNPPVRISLEDPNAINYEDQTFENVIEILGDLLKRGIISENELRMPKKIIEKRFKI